MERACKMLRASPVTVLVLLALAFAPSGAAAADGAGPTGATGPTGTAPPTGADYTETVLSDENLLSRWSFVLRGTIAYAEPLKQGTKIRRLTTRTPDGTNELVLALKERVYPGKGTWVQVRLPMRGSGRTGWVSRNVLSYYHVVRTRLEINRERFRATLFKNGVKVWQSRIGVGKKGTATPAGDFYIRDKLTSTDPHGLYGPYAMGLSAYSDTLSDWPGGGVIGVHGTNQPSLIPGRISHGCIRVPNPKIRRLFKMMPAGTPVKIF